MPPESKPLDRLPTFEGDDLLVVIETPRGSRNKYAFDEAIGAFRLKGVLPEGTTFPYDFGFVPSTRGEDGDALDILVLLDEPAYPGCALTVRPIGAIQAEQQERDGHWERNDRLIGVATNARTHHHIASLADLRPGMVEEIEAFFQHYNRLSGREFRPLGICGRESALELVRKGVAAFAEG